LPIPLTTVQKRGLAHARACASGTLALGAHETPFHAITLFPIAARQNAGPAQAIAGAGDPGATAGPSDTGRAHVEPFHTDACPPAPTAPQNLAVAQDTSTRLVPTTVTGVVQVGVGVADVPLAPSPDRLPPGVVAGTVVADALAAGRNEAGALQAESATAATNATTTTACRRPARSRHVTTSPERPVGAEPSPVSLSHHR
jgi:hypothetical protein